jgi:PCO_ADO
LFRVNVRPIHDEVYPQYDSGGGAMSFVRYIHITEIPEQYSIGIFVFPPFSRIPLHDHPEMCVLSRLLYGDLQCLSLDLPDDPCAQDTGQPSGQKQQESERNHHHAYPIPQPSEQLPPGLPLGSRRAYKNSIKHLHAPDVTVLFPYKGNLHEFYAGPNGAAVLDILLPPYDVDHDRDCTFYDITEDTFALAAAGSQYVQQQMMIKADDMMMTSATQMMIDASPMHSGNNEEPLADERIPCWIVPTHQPHDFHCLSGKYQKLGANVISMQDG